MVNKYILSILTLISFILFVNLISADYFGYGSDLSSATITTWRGNFTNFTGLQDTPASYSGQGGNCVKVGAGETAVEFGSCATGGNASWNQSWAESLFADIEWDYNETTATYNTWNTAWLSTYNATYDSYALNVSLNYSLLTYTNWNTAWLSTYNATYEASVGNASWNESGANLLYIKNNTLGLNLTFYLISSLNWTNITIIESQISDLAHTTDTNASTECSLGDYLDGGSYCLNFNNTVESITESVTYNASGIINLSGVTDAGDVNSLDIAKDGDTYNVSEVSGASPLTIEVNFTGVTNFNTILFRELYDDGAKHEIKICLFDFGDKSFECEYEPNLVDISNFTFGRRDVYDASDHISGGKVSLRFEHIQSGIPSHKFYLDYLVLIDGFSTITGTETDPFFGLYLNESINSTQLEYNYVDAGTLNILESWVSTLFDALFGSKSTDDLSQGSTNLYENASWNESWANTLYADISSEGNASWNESGANLLYAGIEWDYNLTEEVVTLFNTNWSTTYNTTYQSYSLNVSLNYSLLTYTNWNTVWLSTYNITYADWNESYADTLYIKNNTIGWNLTFINLLSTNWTNVTLIESQISDLTHTPLTNIAFINQTNTFAKNQTMEGIFLQNDATAHKIYDNSTCIIITGNTSILEVC